MNKAELIDAMASEAKITKADAGRALQAFMTVTSKTVGRFRYILGCKTCCS